jgi:hypothetical protein
MRGILRILDLADINKDFQKDCQGLLKGIKTSLSSCKKHNNSHIQFLPCVMQSYLDWML